MFKFGDKVCGKNHGVIGVVTYQDNDNTCYVSWPSGNSCQMNNEDLIMASDGENLIEEIGAWFEKAVPCPTDKSRCVQLGCHFEEIKEMSDELGIFSDTDEIHAMRFKEGFEPYRQEIENLTEDRRIALLDSLCDQIVTAVGVAYMFGMDIQGALSEVNRSNWSKFEYGKPVFNGQGKIAKGKDYTPPNLAEYIGG